MPRFMLVVHHGPRTFADMSPEEAQEAFAKVRAWSDRIEGMGKRIGGDKLTEEGGRVLTRKGGRLSVVDGPFAETKEVLGGFMLIHAENYDEAVELTRDCPHLDYARIEIRQVDAIGCGRE
jgi:hypothetical protein